jgi:segregation and condensation protein A
MPMNDPYSIKLPVFEGPLDLLLHLIKENKIDIYDIPIALITHQYLQYIEIMKELNLEIVGEFLVMASTLIHIKSRMLLPVDEEEFPEDYEDPRLELVQRLLEYQAFKEASLSLKEREESWRDYFWREPEGGGEAEEEEAELQLFDMSLFDLIGAFKSLLEKVPAEAIEITREKLTVKDKIALIAERLEDEDTIRFESLFSSDSTRAEMIVTFVALLEVIRLGLARGYQDREFGVIWIINPQKDIEDIDVKGVITEKEQESSDI